MSLCNEECSSGQPAVHDKHFDVGLFSDFVSQDLYAYIQGR